MDIHYIVQYTLGSIFGFFFGVGVATYFPERVQSMLPRVLVPHHHRKKGTHRHE